APAPRLDACEPGVSRTVFRPPPPLRINDPAGVVAKLRDVGLGVWMGGRRRRRQTTPMTNPPNPRLPPRSTFLHRACLPISTNWTNVQALSPEPAGPVASSQSPHRGPLGHCDVIHP